MFLTEKLAPDLLAVSRSPACKIIERLSSISTVQYITMTQQLKNNHSILTSQNMYFEYTLTSTQHNCIQVTWLPLSHCC